jgi:2-aminoadipate transaminase
VTPDEIIVTAGVTQGLMLVAHALANSGDVILVEQPTYLGAINIFSQYGLRMIGVPVDDQGIITDELESLIMAHQPRFLYTIPAFQNPTGVCMSPERRERLLAIAARFQLPIVEDDIYARIAYAGAPPPPLYAADRSRLVVNLSSFSKSLLPGIRIGYVVASPALITRLVRTKQANDLCSPPLMQRAMAAFIQHGWLSNHLRRVVPRYRERRDTLLAAMGRYFPFGVNWTEPQGGFSVWVSLPQSIQVADLYMAGIDQGVAFVPGDAFFVGPAPRPYLRLAFSAVESDVLVEATRILGELLGSQIHRRSLIREAPKDYVPIV